MTEENQTKEEAKNDAIDRRADSDEEDTVRIKLPNSPSSQSLKKAKKRKRKDALQWLIDAAALEPPPCKHCGRIVLAGGWCCKGAKDAYEALEKHKTLYGKKKKDE